MIAAWVVFPALLIALGLACGILLDRLSGSRLPGPTLLAAGLAVVIVAAGLPLLAAATAALAVPAVCLLAVVGGALFVRTRQRWRFDAWAAVAGAATYAIYSAPFVLTGDTTLGGYIRLDDTASWLAITDRVMSHGTPLGYLAPSTYEATLDFYLGSSYPVGGLLPLGVAGRLVGGDLAWLWQPYLSVLGAALALVLYELLTPVISVRPARAAAATIAAQPALLFGEALWGGFKELALAVLIGLLAVLGARIADARFPRGWRALLPLAMTSAAVLTTVNAGGALWLAGVLLPTAAIVVARQGVRAALWRVANVALPTAAFALPALLALNFLAEPAASTVTDGSRLANLIAPLSPLQGFGIWLSGDFRVPPEAPLLTNLLVVVAALAAAAGVWWCLRRGGLGLVLFVAATVSAAVVLELAGSPWVAAKGWAIAAAALLAASAAGVSAMATRGPRAVAPLVGLVLAGGVIGSNIVQTAAVSLLPHDRFAELSAIGERIAGQGPTLITDYDPFAARWFLRRSETEGATELRRRTVATTSGGSLPPKENADIDAFAIDAVLVYRTLVLRRGPTASRPPTPYALTARRRFYDVWQRPPNGEGRLVLAHLPLGDAGNPGATPDCARLLSRVSRTRARRLVAAPREQPLVARLDAGSAPKTWEAAAGRVYPDSSGEVAATLDVPAAGRYDASVAGVVRGRATLTVDGRRVGAIRHELSHGGLHAPLGTLDLSAGRHQVRFEYARAERAPGSAGPIGPIGPVAFHRQGSDADLIALPSSRAAQLCGRRLDWIDLLAR